MRIFHFYLFKNLSIATLFVAFTLIAIIFLTQSLRFLELVIESGASSSSFWILTLLALPRFFEIILPLSLMTSVIFVYNRMMMDSELVVAKSLGYSPFRIAKPALHLAFIVTGFLILMTLYFAPISLSQMQKMQQVVKAQFSSLLFREEVFNQAGSGLTFYIRERGSDGELRGLMIYDSREETEKPYMIIAQRGLVSLGEDGYEIVVFDGSRQEFNQQTRTLQRLNFERYNISVPDSSPINNRWKEPDERTIFELLNPDPTVQRDLDSAEEFHIEIHRRFTAPALALTFTLIALCSLILGPVDRRGLSKRIFLGVLSCIVIQGLYLAAYNWSQRTDIGLIFMYLLVFIPILFCFASLVKKKRYAIPDHTTQEALS